VSIAAHIYCFDTSALIHAWIRAYPPKHFGSLWKQLDGLIAVGRMLSSVEVYNELKKKDDELERYPSALNRFWILESAEI
jgi:hypothetical protein